jgi:hypothetical protein
MSMKRSYRSISGIVLILILTSCIGVRNINSGLQKAFFFIATEEETEIPSEQLTVTRQVVSQSLRHQHWPNNFSDPFNLTNSIKRKNLFTTLGGCRVSRWVYPHPIDNMNKSLEINRKGIFELKKKEREYVGMEDCIYEPVEKWLNSPSQFNPFDTVYVPLNKLSHFINYTLPKITTKIVVISGLCHYYHAAEYNDFTERLLSNQYIVHWFVTNVPIQAPNHTHHPKVCSLTATVLRMIQ